MNLSESDISRIIEMAWEDRTPFDAIEVQFNLSHDEVVNLMRKNLKKKSFNYADFVVVLIAHRLEYTALLGRKKPNPKRYL